MPKVSKYGQNQRASTVMTVRARLLCVGDNVSPALDSIKFTISRSFWSLAARVLVTADPKCISISSQNGGLWSTYQTSRKHRVGVLSCLSECCTTNLFLRQNTSLPKDQRWTPPAPPQPKRAWVCWELATHCMGLSNAAGRWPWHKETKSWQCQDKFQVVLLERTISEGHLWHVIPVSSKSIFTKNWVSIEFSQWFVTL